MKRYGGFLFEECLQLLDSTMLSSKRCGNCISLIALDGLGANSPKVSGHRIVRIWFFPIKFI
jgi:hypothetical protein